MSIKESPQQLSIGIRLRALRERAGLSGRELARRATISQSKISKIETGVLIPSVEDISVLSRALGLSMDVEYRLLHDREIDQAHHLAARRNVMDSFRWHLDAEASAKTVDTFTLHTVPALLQTLEYAAHYLSPNLSTVEMRQVLNLRLQRQAQMLDSAARYRFLVTAGGFRTFTGARGIWERQINSIAFLIGLGVFEIRVIDDDTVKLAQMNDDFALFDSQTVVGDAPDYEAVIYDAPAASRLIARFDQTWHEAEIVTADWVRGLL